MTSAEITALLIQRAEDISKLEALQPRIKALFQSGGKEAVLSFLMLSAAKTLSGADNREEEAT